jgi:hypothetical protein
MNYAQTALAVQSWRENIPEGTLKARGNGDSLRPASERGNWSCPVATAALSTYSLTRIALPRVQNRASSLPARKLSPLLRALTEKVEYHASSLLAASLNRPQRVVTKTFSLQWRHPACLRGPESELAGKQT